MFLLIDNYDSFTYNLVQAFYALGHEPVVLRNDDPAILDMAADPALEMVCISPGPGHPSQTGFCPEFLRRLPHHVRVLWDEAANTGQVPQLEKLVAVIRSREVSLCLLYQQLAQCKAIYDKHAETILGNMDSVVFLGGREASTIKEISENWLGKATISMQTDSRSRGQSESYSQNTQRLGRELMTPAELATMPGDKCILQLRGLPPFFSLKYDLKRHPNYRYTAEADKQKNAFDLDRLINRRRRPGLNEACTMYEVAVPDDALTEEDEDILNYDDIDDPDAFA